VFEAFLRVLGKLKGDNFADHAERFEELIFLDWQGDEVHKNVWVVSLLHCQRHGLHLVLVALALHVLLPADVLSDHKYGPVDGGLFVHLLNGVLCVFTLLEVDIALVCNLTVTANLNLDWVNLAKWFEHLSQLGICGALVQVFHKKVGEAGCAVLVSIAILFLFVQSKLNLLATDTGPIKTLNGCCCVLSAFKLDVAETLAATVWESL
jgi:hypothetical protein